jgi:hypothetical protein
LNVDFATLRIETPFSSPKPISSIDRVIFNFLDGFMIKLKESVKFHRLDLDEKKSLISLKPMQASGLPLVFVPHSSYL